MFKISIALHLFSYTSPLNKEGNSKMSKISIETHTNGTPNPREWHSGRDVTFHYRKLNISVQKGSLTRLTTVARLIARDVKCIAANGEIATVHF